MPGRPNARGRLIREERTGGTPYRAAAVLRRRRQPDTHQAHGRHELRWLGERTGHCAVPSRARRQLRDVHSAVSDLRLPERRLSPSPGQTTVSRLSSPNSILRLATQRAISARAALMMMSLFGFSHLTSSSIRLKSCARFTPARSSSTLPSALRKIGSLEGSSTSELNSTPDKPPTAAAPTTGAAWTDAHAESTSPAPTRD